MAYAQRTNVISRYGGRRLGARGCDCDSCGCGPIDPCCGWNSKYGGAVMTSTAGFRSLPGSARAVGTFGEYIAVGDIEMDPEYVGKGANPNVMGQKPPTGLAASLAAIPMPVKLGVAAFALYHLFVK